ncbi:hypothetical protein, partial [Thermogutta sp.]|uniref:hypothetical protein n=1 Tax=Thermogutta sp. TaxID=1962930 RepID=UPI0032206058
SFNLYAYVRNNPVSAVDPTGRWFDMAGLKGDDYTFARNVLIQMTMRPSGRKVVEELGRDRTFRVKLRAAELNTSNWPTFYLWKARGRQGQPPRFQYGQAYRLTGERGAVVEFDRKAITGEPGRLTGHSSGVVTFGHELGAHVMDLRAGKLTNEIDKTDKDGSAEALGRAIAEERPDLSREEAQKLVEELLGLGEEFSKALVNVTANENPANPK